MAKSQKRPSKESRKPKAEKPKKVNASNPSMKGIPVKTEGSNPKAGLSK